MTLTIRTLNGRFVIVTALFLLILLSLAIYSFVLVQKTAEENYLRIEKNVLLSRSVHELIDEVRNTENNLHQYSSYLSRDKLVEINMHMDNTNNLIWAFVKLPEVTENPQISDYAIKLVEDVILLNSIVADYQNIMHDVESRYPAMPILLDKLQPLNRQFSEAVELALQEGELTEFRPGVVAKDQYNIMRLFHEVRYAWSMQVSWFRVFVANRMGAFGDPEIAMRNNLENRSMFMDNVMNTLEQLNKYNKKELLGIQQEESIKQMTSVVDAYNRHLEDAVEIYFSDDWRADSALIKKSLQPRLESVLEKATHIEKIIYDSNRQATSISHQTATTLSWFIFVFTATVFVMMLVVAWIFQRNVRKPVLQLANQMQSESLTSDDDIDVRGNFEEINLLIDAYNDMRHQIYNRQLRLESILDNAAEGIITIDDRGKIETFNSAAQQLFAYEGKEVLGQSFAVLLSAGLPGSIESKLIESIQQGKLSDFIGGKELRAKRKDGREFIMSLKISEMKIDEKKLFTAIVDDITERRAAMDHLRHVAEHDSLTGLHNRQYFNAAMQREFDRAKRDPDSLCACIYIDLDNFKYINDTLGHLEGDRLLVGIANTLATRTRKSDILARLGGDEFALILIGAEQRQVEIIADNYRAAISTYNFTASGKHIDTGCSIGVAMYDVTIDSKDAFLARADMACHMAKRAGRNHVHIFENKDKDRIDTFYQEMGWTRRIRHALENDDFVFSCQPILNVQNSNLFSHELLLRMRDPDTGEYILPSGFFDSAERFGLMPEIDKWVIEHAFEWLNMQSSQDGLCYFINLSGKSIGDAKILDVIRKALLSLKIEPGRIVFEITEDVAIADFDKAKHFLTELRNMGFKTALDDFGVGYSSFSYLRELDVDYVKIDGAFINSMHDDELNFALVKAINDVCHILGKLTIAEYVQNEKSMRLLQEIGVDYAQGYNIAVASDYDQKTIQFRVAGQ